MKRFCKFVSDYMGVLVLLSALAALLFPGTIGHLKPKLINPLLGVIMFGMGLTLTSRRKISRWCSAGPRTCSWAAWRSSR